MKENECKKCIYRQSEQSMSRKVNAFNTAFQKVSGFAALAECVADAVDDIEIAINDQNRRRYEKLVGQFRFPGPGWKRWCTCNPCS